MKRFKNHQAVLVLTFLIGSLFLLYGCGGGGSSTVAPGLTGGGTISGTAVKGPVNGGTVKAYTIENGTKGA